MGDHKLSTRKPQQRQLSQRRARKTTVTKYPHLTANAANLFDVFVSFQHCSNGPPAIDWHFRMHACYDMSDMSGQWSDALNREIYRSLFLLVM